VDGIAGITARIAAIQQQIAAVSAPRAPVGGTRGDGGTVPVGGTTAGVPGASGSRGPAAGAPSFAAALAREAGAVGVRATGAGGASAAALRDATLPVVPGLSREQVGNAAAVVRAGAGMGLSLRDQAIGVMTALGESSLRVLDHGDRAGPDSRGLFQQRDNGAWGTLAERMDPTASAQSFFRALTRVADRDAMSPTLVAHRVQRNADPQHYARWWDQAVGTVAALTGAPRATVTTP
jgi:hypothetical protein